MLIMKVQVKKLNETAKIPVYAHENDAGMDLFALEEITINAGDHVQIKTGIAIALPDGYVGLLWDKSGISHRHGLKVMGGVIDSGYRGEILVGMVNLGKEPHTFKAGDKITQMLIQKVEYVFLEEVSELSESMRGEKGFGSTGK